MLFAFLLDKRFACFGNVANKDTLAAFWTPDEVVDNKVDAVFISDIFHVAMIYSIYQYPRFGHSYKSFVFNELQWTRRQIFKTPI